MWHETTGRVDILQLTFVRFRWLLISSVLAFAILFTVAAFVITPKYRAFAVLAPASNDRVSVSSTLGAVLGQLGGIASLAGMRIGDLEPGSEEALAVLRSRQFTEAFIRDENLIPKLFWRRWDNVHQMWTVPPADQPTPAKAFHLFDEHIRTVSEDTKTGLVTLQIEWKDRQEAASWANKLVDRLNREMRDRAIVKADDSVGFLQKELAITSDVGTRDAINRLIEAQVKQKMIANVTREFVFRVVDEAFAPEADEAAKPRKALLIAAGPFVGFLFGFALIYATAYYGRLKGRIRAGA